MYIYMYSLIHLNMYFNNLKSYHYKNTPITVIYTIIICDILLEISIYLL